MADQLMEYLRPNSIVCYKFILDGQEYDVRYDGAIKVFIHGACRGNHLSKDTDRERTGGVGVHFKKDSELNYGGRISNSMSYDYGINITNNRAEAMAVLTALKIVLNETAFTRVCLYTNSTYITTVMANLGMWHAKNYRNCLLNGDDAKNVHILYAIWGLVSRFDNVECELLSSDNPDIVEAGRLAKFGVKFC